MKANPRRVHPSPGILREDFPSHIPSSLLGHFQLEPVAGSDGKAEKKPDVRLVKLSACRMVTSGLEQGDNHEKFDKIWGRLAFDERPWHAVMFQVTVPHTYERLSYRQVEYFFPVKIREG
ncbi:hypothetical protein BSK56_33125 [Paenibacillus borealis]|uniref:Integron-associated effector binding protein domain-containing protein n=1 Tax=Paenibacillus borealis TaxID=160799 RepID=A0ABX3GUX7_PAEBO|nr:hypothetical protein BSK56_33125 [Paenibacillus borealis]